MKALVTGLTESIDLEVKKMLSDYSRTPGNKVFDYKVISIKKRIVTNLTILFFKFKFENFLLITFVMVIFFHQFRKI